MSDYRCTGGHDKCMEMLPSPDCPYCEDATGYQQKIADAATEAQREAKAYTDRGLLEAIYILLRRDAIIVEREQAP